MEPRYENVNARSAFSRNRGMRVATGAAGAEYGVVIVFGDGDDCCVSTGGEVESFLQRARSLRASERASRASKQAMISKKD